jgi:hypothetical protein
MAHALLIVPRAHLRFERTFQTEMFELFHRKPVARWGHLLCTPLIVIALLVVLAAAVPRIAVGAIALDGATLGAIAIVLWSLYVDRLAGLLVLLLALAAVPAAHALAALLGQDALLLGLAGAWAGGLLQAISHISEPIPPPWTGSHRFVPLGEWLRAAPPSRIASLVLLSPTVFPLLELWAAPRVWVLEVLHLLMRAGYRLELRARLDERVDEMLNDARTGWPQPELATR